MLKKKRTKKAATIYQTKDGKVFSSKALFDFYNECQEALKRKIIKSFKMPDTAIKKSRYTSYKPIIDDIKFDSMMESRYYIKLLYDKKIGLIKDFELQKAFELQPSFTKNKKKYQKIEYICDFMVYVNDSEKYTVDIKGKETVDFRLKHKMFEYKYQDLTLKVIQYHEHSHEWLELNEIRKITRKTKTKKTTK